MPRTPASLRPPFLWLQVYRAQLVCARAQGLGLVLILTSKIEPDEPDVLVWTSEVPIFNPQASAKRGVPAPSRTAKMNSKTDMLLLLPLLVTRFEIGEHGPHIWQCKDGTFRLNPVFGCIRNIPCDKLQTWYSLVAPSMLVAWARTVSAQVVSPTFPASRLNWNKVYSCNLIRTHTHIQYTYR